LLAILDLLTRGLTRGLAHTRALAHTRVLAHKVIIGESQLVCAGALLVQTRIGALALGPGRRQPRTMLGFLGTACARLRRFPVLGSRLRPTLLQHALAPALGRGTTASTHCEQQCDHNDDRDHDDHDDQSSRHTLNLLFSFEEASR
jgi:hypothetical protein